MFFIATISVNVSYKKITNAKEWMKGNSIVETSNIEKYHRSKGITYCPVIMVRYYFEKKQYISKLDISNGSCNPIKQLVKNTIKNYNKGVDVMIYINPLNPSKIQLYNYPFGFYSWLMIFLLIISFIAFIYILVTPAIKLDRNEEDANKP